MAKPCAFAYADRSADDQAADDRPAVVFADAHADRAADTGAIAPADGGSDAEPHFAAEPCPHDGSAERRRSPSDADRDAEHASVEGSNAAAHG